MTFLWFSKDMWATVQILWFTSLFIVELDTCRHITDLGHLLVFVLKMLYDAIYKVMMRINSNE